MISDEYKRDFHFFVGICDSIHLSMPGFVCVFFLLYSSLCYYIFAKVNLIWIYEIKLNMCVRRAYDKNRPNRIKNIK